MKKLLFGLAILLFCLAAPYVFQTYGLKTVSEEDLPDEGGWAQLTQGNIYYRWHEPEINNGQVVVMVHGFSTPHFVWNGMKGFLLDAGFRVLVYDHLGRGFSDKPNLVYDQSLYIDTLKELLDDQNISESAHFVGYSMGGPVVGHFAASYPDLVKSMSLIAPAGFMIESPTANMWTLRPLIGEWFWNIFAPTMFFNDGPIISTDPLALSTEDFIAGARTQLQYKGFVRSLLSTARHFNLFNAEATFAEVGRLEIPTLTIWGTADGVVPFSGSEGLLELIPHSRLIVIDDGGHNITYAQPTIVGTAIRDFLNEGVKL